MEKFLLLIREDVKKLNQLPEEELMESIQEMTQWVEGLAQSGNFVSGDPLLTTGRYVSKHDVLSDGPFIEAKEAISGYLLIKAETLDQAASIVQTCPHVSQGKIVIEVRPIMTVANE